MAKASGVAPAVAAMRSTEDQATGPSRNWFSKGRVAGWLANV